MIGLQVNGMRREVPEGTSLGLLLQNLQLDPGRVAVERNEAIVPRGEFDETTLQEGDRLEVVQFVGGG